ncbi:hypothetical protein MMC11_008590 [Xylographa trunciseda]|nr:hypothetical protein [Xylographa trunciseda]
MVIPAAMMWAIGINGILGFVMLLTFCFTLGDIDSILTTNLGFPFIQVFFNSTESYTGTTILVVIVLVTITSSAISTIGTASRQLWSFARDNGLPFSPFFARVQPGWNIPLRAVLVSLGVNVVLSMINIGSSVALNAITALMVSSLLSSYMVSTMCLLCKRLRGEPLPESRWTLGRFGIYINTVALMFLVVIWIFTFFPITTNVNSTTMNWNVLMYFGVMIFAAVYYMIWGRHVYVGPVALIKRDLRYPNEERFR